MACPSCTAEWLSAARQEGPVDDLDDGTQLRFVDQRMFGGLEFVREGGGCPVPHIALDPFDPNFDFDPVAVARRMRGKRTTVKRAILDQGLGIWSSLLPLVQTKYRRVFIN